MTSFMGLPPAALKLLSCGFQKPQEHEGVWFSQKLAYCSVSETPKKNSPPFSKGAFEDHSISHNTHTFKKQQNIMKQRPPSKVLLSCSHDQRELWGNTTPRYCN